MSTEHLLSPPAAATVTSHDVEHPHAIGRRIKAGPTIVGAGAAAILALGAGSPTANADPSTVVLPDFATGTATVDSTVFDVPLLFDSSTSTVIRLVHRSAR